MLPGVARLILFLAAAASGLRAHDPGLSTVEGEWRPDGLELTTGFAPADAARFLPPNILPPEEWTAAEFERVWGELASAGAGLWELQSGGRIVAPIELRVTLASNDTINFQHFFPPLPGRITLRATRLADLPAGHRQFVFITDEDGSSLAKKLLGPTDPAFELERIGAGAGDPATAPRGPDSPIFLEFMRLGVEHIWIGYDHLLFLFALLVVCRRFWSIVAIISCFTLAHSLTLALATLELASLPGWLVEPAIAASIVFVGAENLVRRGAEPPGRWALTFAFGLIHGFGFASVLRDLGIGETGSEIALPLLAFNLGVEIGQIAIAAVVLPLLWLLLKRPVLAQRTTMILSAVVTAAGLYWLLERTVFA
jgi:hydrogenase/urease accessory protein HupE